MNLDLLIRSVFYLDSNDLECYFTFSETPPFPMARIHAVNTFTKAGLQ